MANSSEAVRIGGTLPVEVAEGETRTCAAHGEFLARVFLTPSGSRLVSTECPKCSEEKRAADIAAERKARREARIRSAGIPLRYAEVSLESFVADEPAKQNALSAARAWLADFKRRGERRPSMILCGTVGTGKTHLLCALAHAVLDDGGSALYRSVADAISEIRAAWKNGGDELAAYKSLARADLLILDEVGVQTGSDNEELILTRLLNKRYEALLPTLLASNKNARGVAEYLGERVIDRLREDGGRVVQMEWDSYRRREAREVKRAAQPSTERTNGTTTRIPESRPPDPIAAAAGSSALGGGSASATRSRH